ncbi:hypothetical protein KY312_02005 [Candidatus Woesearchaeota archaeon]|nr:hypothetical protein [Candidatus Woesearchaeota archaeon]
MTLENELQFDEDGCHYFVNSKDLCEAKGYKFVARAHVENDSLQDRILYVTLKNGWIGDFASEDVVMETDRNLDRVEGVEETYWEDREYFHITYEKDQDLPELIKRIDAKLDELSQRKNIENEEQ